MQCAHEETNSETHWRLTELFHANHGAWHWHDQNQNHDQDHSTGHSSYPGKQTGQEDGGEH